MQSAPDNSSAVRMMSNVSYLPVPTIRRLARVCRPNFSELAAFVSVGVKSVATCWLTSASQCYDFEFIAIVQSVLSMLLARDKLPVNFDRHMARIKIEPMQ
jgi:hypothetical protein